MSILEHSQANYMLLLLLHLLLHSSSSFPLVVVGEVISSWGWQQDGETVHIQNQEEHIKPKKMLAKIELDSKLPSCMIHTCMHAHTYAHTRTHAHTYTCTLTHTHTHTVETNLLC